MTDGNDMRNNNEIIFYIEESEEGGYVARALGHSIFTDGESEDDLKANIKDAVLFHFHSSDTKSPGKQAATCA